jgi:hypothetical protein
MRPLRRRRALALALAAAVVAFGCRRGASEPAASGNTPPPAQAEAAPGTPASPTTTTVPAQTAVARIELGYETDADGAIPRGLESREFSAASKFTLAVRTADLAAGTRLSVRWTDSAGAVVATDTRAVPAGARFVAFASPDTSAWQSAAYRVAVDVDDQPAGALDFRVDAASGAGS